MPPSTPATPGARRPRRRRPLRLIAALVVAPPLAGAIALAAPGGGGAIAAPDGSPLSAASAPPVNGATIGGNPSLAPGVAVVVGLPGFAAEAALTLRLDGTFAVTARAESDGAGTATVRFDVPTDLPAGAHRLVISARPPAPSAPPPPSDSSATVTVTVPQTAVFPFTVESSVAPAG